MPDTGATSERLEALRVRWESDKGSRVFLQLADEYRRLGRGEDAVQVLQEGLAENPRYPAAQVALGRAQLELGRADEAAETLERVVEGDPTQMVAYRLLVEAYVAQGRPEEARQRLRVYSLLNDADPDIAELRRRIGQLERQDRSEEAPAPPPEAASAPEAEAPGAAEVYAEPATEPPPLEEPAAEPFPGLAAAPSGGRSVGDDVFDLSPYPPAPPQDEDEEASPPAEPARVPVPPPPEAPAAPEAASRSAEPFDLGPPDRPPAPDLSSLVEEEAPPRPAAARLAPAPATDLPPTAPAAEELAGEPDAAAPEPAQPLPENVEEAGRPTVTLGLLYLRQGHTREAEEIFRAVLDRDPDNSEALSHLEEIGEQLRAELGEPRRLTAADLLDGWEGGAQGPGTTERKRYVLERYRGLLRGRKPGDVH